MVDGILVGTLDGGMNNDGTTVGSGEGSVVRSAVGTLVVGTLVVGSADGTSVVGYSEGVSVVGYSVGVLLEDINEECIADDELSSSPNWFVVSLYFISPATKNGNRQNSKIRCPAVISISGYLHCNCCWSIGELWREVSVERLCRLRGWFV